MMTHYHAKTILLTLQTFLEMIQNFGFIRPWRNNAHCDVIDVAMEKNRCENIRDVGGYFPSFLSYAR